MKSLTLNDLATIIGLVFGTVALVLAYFTYRRDSTRVRVTLKWDQRMMGPGNPDKLWGIVTVTNIGRRPVFVNHVHLCIRRLFKYDKVILIRDHNGNGILKALAGRQLKEGAEPHDVLIDQAGFEKFATYWNRIYAQVSDSTGKQWKSKPAGRLWKYRATTKSTGPPSWAKK